MADPRAGQPAAAEDLVDVAKLVTAYYAVHPDPGEAAQRVSFGTSGHRGSAFTATFNEDHILATTQAICEYRAAHGIDGPLYLGADTHALSEPARVSALEVLAANGVRVLVDAGGGYTPTPSVSRAISSARSIASFECALPLSHTTPSASVSTRILPRLVMWSAASLDLIFVVMTESFTNAFGCERSTSASWA